MTHQQLLPLLYLLARLRRSGMPAGMWGTLFPQPSGPTPPQIPGAILSPLVGGLVPGAVTSPFSQGWPWEL